VKNNDLSFFENAISILRKIYLFKLQQIRICRKYEAGSIILLDVKEENWYEKTDSNKATAPIIIGIET
jgi:hypothetical protein